MKTVYILQQVQRNSTEWHNIGVYTSKAKAEREIKRMLSDDIVNNSIYLYNIETHNIIK